MTARPLVPTTRVVIRFFPQERTLHCVQGIQFVPKQEVISTEVRYHFSFETLGSLPTCDSPCLYCTPHSPVVSIAIQLVIHDDYLDSECPTA